MGAVAAALTIASSFQGPALSDEFVYLAGAHRFADTSSLSATYYFTDSILTTGHPHQDAHSPGYVIALGTLMRLLGPGYETAIILNVAYLLMSMILLWQISVELGRPLGARLMTMAVIALPGVIAYTSWVMAEGLVLVTSLATIWIAVRFGLRPVGALLCGLALGGCILIRESAIFLAPVLVLLIGASRVRFPLFAGALTAFHWLVWIPLSAGRPALVTTGARGTSVNSIAYRALRDGRLLDAARSLLERVNRNLANLTIAEAEQQIALFCLVAVPALAWLGWKEAGSRSRLMLIGLSVGFAGMLIATLTSTDLVGWNGPRYLVFLAAPFFALLPDLRQRRARLLVAAVLAIGLFDAGSILLKFRAAKGHGAQALDEVEYFDRHVAPKSYTRVVWQNGYRLGLRHYPAEVIVSIPQNRRQYRMLARAVWFDYVVLSNWQTVLDEEPGYELINREEPERLLKIFKRLDASPIIPR